MASRDNRFLTLKGKRKLFMMVALVNSLGNSIRIGAEGILGLYFGSMALIARAVDSVADLLNSFVVLLLGRESFKEADSGHPHGHERIEPLSALLVGLAIILLGLKILYDGVMNLSMGPSVKFSFLLIGGLLFSLVDKGLLYWYTRRENRKLDSTALRALTKDSMTDIFASMAAMIGVVGVSLNYPVLDPIAGILVSGMVVYQGIVVVKENIGYLIGAAPAAEKRREIEEAVRAHPEVKGVHKLIVHHIGPVLEAEMHVEIDGDKPLREAHAIETEIEESVLALDKVAKIHIHLESSRDDKENKRRKVDLS